MPCIALYLRQWTVGWRRAVLLVIAEGLVDILHGVVVGGRGVERSVNAARPQIFSYHLVVQSFHTASNVMMGSCWVNPGRLDKDLWTSCIFSTETVFFYPLIRAKIVLSRVHLVESENN